MHNPSTTILNRRPFHRSFLLILIMAATLWLPYVTQASPLTVGNAAATPNLQPQASSVDTFADASSSSLNSTCPYIPGGSYHLTCRNIQATLSAECQKLDGSWQFSILDLTNLNNVDVANTNGTLQVVGNSSTPLQGYIPNGSYRLTCRTIQVTLSAECEKLDGSWEFTTLNLTTLSNADVVNSDGKLFAR